MTPALPPSLPTEDAEAGESDPRRSRLPRWPTQKPCQRQCPASGPASESLGEAATVAAPGAGATALQASHFQVASASGQAALERPLRRHCQWPTGSLGHGGTPGGCHGVSFGVRRQWSQALSPPISPSRTCVRDDPGVTGTPGPAGGPASVHLDDTGVSMSRVGLVFLAPSRRRRSGSTEWPGGTARGRPPGNPTGLICRLGITGRPGASESARGLPPLDGAQEASSF